MCHWACWFWCCSNSLVCKEECSLPGLPILTFLSSSNLLVQSNKDCTQLSFLICHTCLFFLPWNLWDLWVMFIALCIIVPGLWVWTINIGHLQVGCSPIHPICYWLQILDIHYSLSNTYPSFSNCLFIKKDLLCFVCHCQHLFQASIHLFRVASIVLQLSSLVCCTCLFFLL